MVYVRSVKTMVCMTSYREVHVCYTVNRILHTFISHMPLHFRGKILPVSLVLKVLFCMNRVLHIF